MRRFATLRIQSEYREIGNRNNSVFGHFSHSEGSVKYLRVGYIRNGLKPLAICLINSILNVLPGSKYASEMCLSHVIVKQNRLLRLVATCNNT